jgi:hypothetical protein
MTEKILTTKKQGMAMLIGIILLYIAATVALIFSLEAGILAVTIPMFVILCLGWILIPDSPISYPMVQGNNNSYYLKRTWRGNSSVVGAIFLDAQCDDDFSDFNTIIYGHRMNNGSMFAGLAKYKNYSYYKSRKTRPHTSRSL